MAVDPDELLPRKKKTTEVEIGQDLYSMSEHDLEERIALLDGEIMRCREAIKARQATKHVADKFFKK